MVCAGCDREFDDPLYLQLDHKTPRSEGGLNHISNRMLLCGPMQPDQVDRLTLSGLRGEREARSDGDEKRGLTCPEPKVPGFASTTTASVTEVILEDGEGWSRAVRRIKGEASPQLRGPEAF